MRLRKHGIMSCFVLVQGIMAVVLLATPSAGQTITTVAGGYVGDGGQATSAALNFPEYAVMDQHGNLFISDPYYQRIRKVDPSGVITTVAGTGIAGYNGDGGPAGAAQLNFPTGLLIDPAGNLIVAEQGNYRIRMINPAAVISTIAGNGTPGYSGDGGLAIAASVTPWAVALDSYGNLFFSDATNHFVRKIDLTGKITTVAGTGIATGSLDGEGGNPADDLGDGGWATKAALNGPRSVLPDAAGNVYIADTSNHRVRKVDASGHITTVAGNGQKGFSGDGGPATQAKVGNPRGLAFDHDGNLLIGNGGGRPRVRKVDLHSGIISTVAGSFGGFDGDGHSALDTRFGGLTGLSHDRSGNLLVVDSVNQRVRRIDSSTQIVSTIAGGFIGDGNHATAASLNEPQNLTLDSAGNIYIADSLNNRVRKVDRSGRIRTIAGTGINGHTGDDGPANAATLDYPLGVAVSPAKGVFIADTNNGAIRKVDALGKIETLAQDYSSSLASMAFGVAGGLYFVDQGKCVIRKLEGWGMGAIVAGVEGTCGFNGDGIRATSAQLKSPYGVAVDLLGNLYIGDTGNHRVRKVDRAGTITTIAGIGTCGFSGDGGLATAAKLCSPCGIALDWAGNLFIADADNLRVRMVGLNNKITTIAGNGQSGFNGDGISPISAALDYPIAVAVDNRGNVYVADIGPSRIRKIALRPGP
jgi:sugar lactone lactonase YvrE